MIQIVSESVRTAMIKVNYDIISNIYLNIVNSLSILIW